MMVISHQVKRFLRPASLSQLAREPRVMEAARTLVRCFYYVAPFAAFLFATNEYLARQNFQPFGPLVWVDLFSVPYVVVLNLVLVGALAITLCGVLWYQHRAMRILVFLAFMQAHALESSFGSINHQWYVWVYTSFIFIFLPHVWDNKEDDAEKNRLFLLHIWFAQALLMLTYTLAGIDKLRHAVDQFFAGEVHGFAPEAFAYQIAEWLPQLQVDALWGPFIIEYPYAGWLPYVAIHFIQLFSLWVMVRMSLQKVWALVLILFHAGTFLTMGISFHPVVLGLVVLFLLSPFVDERVSYRKLFFDLPVIGQVAEWWVVRRRA